MLFVALFLFIFYIFKPDESNQYIVPNDNKEERFMLKNG
jgi:hypothetical protein